MPGRISSHRMTTAGGPPTRVRPPLPLLPPGRPIRPPESSDPQRSIAARLDLSRGSSHSVVLKDKGAVHAPGVGWCVAPGPPNRGGMTAPWISPDVSCKVVVYHRLSSPLLSRLQLSAWLICAADLLLWGPYRVA